MTKNTKKQKKNEKIITPGKGKLDKFINFLTRGITPYCIIVAIIFGVYFQTLSYGVTGLDDDTILNNANSQIYKNNIFEACKTDAFLSQQGNTFYRPVQGLSYIIDSRLCNTNQFYFHLTNLILHAICCILLFYLITLFKNNKKISLLLTLLYAIHPLFNQAVIWLPSRGDLLMTMFSLLAFISFIKFTFTKNYIFFLLNIVSFLLAVFSKEIAVLLPVIFLLYSNYKEKNLKKTFNINNIMLTISWSIIILVYLVIRSNIVKITLNSGQFGIEAFIHNLPVIPELISKFFIPFNLSVLPEFNIVSVIIGLVIISSILFFTLKRKNLFGNYSFLFIAWFVLFTVTAMLYRHEHLNNAYDYLEHRAYMPLIGIILLIASIRINQQRMKIFSASVFVILLIFTGLTLSRSSIFKDPVSFYTSATEKGTKVALAYYNLGTIREKLNDNIGALEDFNKAIELKRDYDGAYNNRGIVRKNMGNLEGARNDFSHIIEIKPDDEIAFNNRGLIKRELGELEGALKDFNKAIELKPNYPEPYYNRGNLKKILRDKKGAEQDYNRAIELKNEYFESFLGRALIKFDNGDIKGAKNDINRAIAINPNYIEALVASGYVRISIGDMDGVKDFFRVIEINPNYEIAYNNIGFYYVNIKDYKNAVSFFEKAVKIKPNYSEAWKNLGLARQNLKDMNGACEAWKKAVEFGNVECKYLLNEFCR